MAGPVMKILGIGEKEEKKDKEFVGPRELYDMVQEHEDRLNNKVDPTIAEHTNMLNAHSDVLNKHSDTLNKLSESLNYLTDFSNELNKHSAILNDHASVINKHSGDITRLYGQIQNNGSWIDRLNNSMIVITKSTIPDLNSRISWLEARQKHISDRYIPETAKTLEDFMKRISKTESDIILLNRMIGDLRLWMESELKKLK